MPLFEFLSKDISCEKDEDINVKTESDLECPMHVDPGTQTMGASLQRKYAKGVQYNMKIVIRGDKNVGKTSLFHRLKGDKFSEEYEPTEETQMTSIQWNYKATDDVMKVQVWDVFDKGKRRRTLEEIKLENADQAAASDEMFQDAELDDVYDGCDGVILVFDITKQWSLGYVECELARIPDHMPVLVLGNFRDMRHHRAVSTDSAQCVVDSLQRPDGRPQIGYAESSMRNGFGLKYLHRFFKLSFLILQFQPLDDVYLRSQSYNDQAVQHDRCSSQPSCQLTWFSLSR